MAAATKTPNLALQHLGEDTTLVPSDYNRALDQLDSAVGGPYAVAVTAPAGASNVSTVTIQAKDAAGNNLAGVRQFDILTTSDAAGKTLSVTAYSGTLVAVTGSIAFTGQAKHIFRIQTDATGLFTGSLTDTAKTADYIAVQRPSVGGIGVATSNLGVSPAMAFG